MSPVVLDASALLALLAAEEGSSEVSGVLDGARVSAVNWSEVIERSLAVGFDPGGLREDLASLGLAVADFDAEQAEIAARLRDRTRERGLSLADRACLALASRIGAPALTADRAWEGLDLGIEVRLVR